MKILIVNQSDISGGAARAAYRLHNGLLERGINSQMLVQKKSSDDYTVIGLTTKKQKILAKIFSFLDKYPLNFYKGRSKTKFSPAWVPSSNTIKIINSLNADIVHLHWINNGMIRIEDLTKIKAPIVWSLHDNWAFTGGCHVKWECERFTDKCGSCPRLGSNKENDLSRKVWNRKRKVFAQLSNIVIIGLSGWMTECAKRSSLFQNIKIIKLPNPINTNQFKLFDKLKSRELWNLSKSKKLILFGAIGGTKIINKGYKELSEALKVYKDKDIELAVFGSSTPQFSQKFGFKTHYLGPLFDDVSLLSVYNAVDVLVVPSLQENLSNVVMESLACGTPVVAFDIGGNSDMIEHKKNGYLARPYNTQDLANGIEFILNAQNYNELCNNAREKILNEFKSDEVIKKYLILYNELLKKKD